METTCDIKDVCIINNVNEKEDIIFGECIISYKVARILCKNCDSKYKEIILRIMNKKNNERNNKQNS